jgi:hypothetical protein
VVGEKRMMNKNFIGIILAFMFLSLGIVKGAKYSSDFLIGYNGGPGFQINIVASEFAKDFPLNMQFGIAYSALDPGNAADARKIFINDATNGDPEKSAWMWDMRFDFQYKVNWLPVRQVFLYGGPRYSMYTANFNFVGGNENFDINTNQWGLGLGLKAYFAMGSKIDFVTSAGFDYYFDSSLSGHDTVYSPDGENVNSRNDYTFQDADAAINNPKFQFRLMVGINYHF